MVFAPLTADRLTLGGRLSTGARLAAFKSAIAGRYLVDTEVGRGGMAVVFLAREVRLGRRVAVKVLAPPVASPSAVQAFGREVEHTVRLEHPNILPLVDAGEAEGLPFYAMRYARDGSLRRRLRERRLSLGETVAIVRQVAGALQFAHDHDLLHCDVKPENILFQGDHVYLADFGISRALRGNAFDWSPNGAVSSGGGTATYVSPEQALGESTLDGRTDLYSLACVSYEMLVGRAPFAGRNERDVVARRFTTSPMDLRELARAVPASVRTEIARALSLDAPRRHGSVGEFADRLGAAAGRGAETAATERRSLSGVRRAVRSVARVFAPRASRLATAPTSKY